MVDLTLRRMEQARGFDPETSFLAKLLEEMHKHVSLMQERLGELKKVPFTKVVRPLERAVRDLSGALKKQVNFKVEGSDVRIDTATADLLGRCLIHLVRNSLDHGIEMPEFRKGAGKAEAGSLNLTCTKTANFVVVTLADDGKGIDPAFLRPKLVEKKLCTPEEAAALSDQEVQEMIFAPGFSTAAAVTDVSGRGVGTDMVKGSVLAAGGRLLLRSRPGAGTTFELHLPVIKSVDIVQCLHVRVADEIFAVPQDAVERVILLDLEKAGGRLEQLDTEYLWREDGELIPVVNVERVLGFEVHATRPKSHLLRLRAQNRRFAIFIDEVIDSSESVVRRLDPMCARVPCYRGATFLSDGRVAIVLATDGIAEMGGLGAAAPAREGAASFPPSTRYLLVQAGGPETFAVREADILRVQQAEPGQNFEQGGRRCLRFGEGLAPETSLLGARLEAPGFWLFLRGTERPLALALREIGDFIECPDAVVAGAESEWAHGKLVIVGERLVHVVEAPGLTFKDREPTAA